tara:strand:- start:2627 stop:3184 length:558 start_codon:yes stop_codon:yes gene_type:complete
MHIIGLGNPGSKYDNTKHNIGYWVVDQLANTLDMNFKLGKGEYMLSQSPTVTLLKPLTFMNNSGIAVKHYVDYFDIDINNLLIVYDDADLVIGQFKFKSKGRSAGQKGLDSIIYHLKTDNFLRLKIGIGNNTQHLKSYVLSPFEQKDKVIIDNTINHCCEAIQFLLQHTIDDTMNKYNIKNKESN